MLSGHVITTRRLYIATKTIDAVRDLMYPTSTSKLLSFLGLYNVYRRLVSNILQMAAPLNK